MEEEREIKKIRVALIEDHAELRQSFAFIINNNPQLSCTAYARAEDALEDLKTAQPHVVLMDINLPGMDGIECTRIIKQQYPHINIMMCTSYDDDDKVYNALAAGASGYLVKRTAGDRLVETILELHHGGSPMSSGIARKVVAAFSKFIPTSPQEDYHLTPKENEVLDHLADGLRMKEIAERMFVSLNTIRRHVFNIYEKLHVQGRVEALNKTGRGFRR